MSDNIRRDSLLLDNYDNAKVDEGGHCASVLVDVSAKENSLSLVSESMGVRTLPQVSDANQGTCVASTSQGVSYWE